MKHFFRAALLFGSCLGLSVAPVSLRAQNADLDGFADTPSGDGRVTLTNVSYPIPSGTVRYVKPDGNDDLNGTSLATAWRDPVEAVRKAPAGATIVFAEGRYETGDVTISKKLTLQPMPGAKVWFVGTRDIASWAREGTTNVWYTTASAQAFEMPVDDCTSCLVKICPNGSPGFGADCAPTEQTRVAGFLDMVFKNDIGLKQVARKALLEPGTFWVDKGANRIYARMSNASENPNNLRMEGTTQVRGVNITPGGAGTVVQGIGLRGYAKNGMIANAQNFTIENCTFAWNGLNGAYLGGSEQLKGVSILNNIFSYNGRLGLGLYGTENPAEGSTKYGSNKFLLVEQNVFSYNNNEGFSMGWESGGMKMLRLDDAVFSKNVFENNLSTGCWLDLDVERVKVVNNTARNNRSIGIFFEISRGALIAGNTCYNNGAGIQASGSSGVAIYHNTLYDNTTNLRITDDKRTIDSENLTTAQRNAYKGRGIWYETYEVRIQNNVLADARKWPIEVLNGDCRPVPQALAGKPTVQVLNNNLYLHSTNPNSPSGQKPPLPTTDKLQWKPASCTANKEYINLANFNAQTDFEEAGKFVGGQALGNLFVDATNGDDDKRDYRLKPCAWAPPAAAALTGTLTVAAAVGSTPAFTVSGAELRQILGVASTATLKVGNEQTQAACTKKPQTITFPTLADKALNSGPVALAATTTSGLPVSYSVTGPATLNSAGTALTLTGAGRVTVRANQEGNAEYARASEVERSFVATGVALALNAGGEAFAYENITYAAEGSYVTGGTALDRPTRAIAGTEADRLYQTERYGDFAYALPLENGTYEVNLKFAELFYETNGANQRLFDVLAEGALRYSNLDVYTQAGGANTALNRTFTLAVTDGTLNLQFRSEVGKNNAQLCALVVRRISDDNDGPTAARTSPAATAAASPAALSVSPSEQTASLSAFPNPNHGQATLELRAATAQRARVDVFDQQGRLVAMLTFPVQAGRTEFRLPTELAVGTYHLTTRLDGQALRFTVEVN